MAGATTTKKNVSTQTGASNMSGSGSGTGSGMDVGGPVKSMQASDPLALKQPSSIVGGNPTSPPPPGGMPASGNPVYAADNSPRTPGWNQGTTDPLTGMMAQYGYTPQGLGNLYSNPNQLAGDVLGGMGINNPGLASQFGDYMNPALFANFLLNGGRGASLNDNDALNFVANYMQQMGTPGGRTPQLDVLINDILGVSGQGPQGGNLGSPLWQYFESDPNTGLALTPDQQVKVANQALGQSMTSMNPLAQRAYAAYAANAGQQYQQALNKGQSLAPNYLSYLQQSGLPGYIRR